MLLDSRPSHDPEPPLRSRASDTKSGRRDPAASTNDDRRANASQAKITQNTERQETPETTQPSTGQKSPEAAQQASSEKPREGDQTASIPNGEIQTGNQSTLDATVNMAAPIPVNVNGPVPEEAAANLAADAVPVAPVAATPVVDAPIVPEAPIALPEGPSAATPATAPAQLTPAAQPAALPIQAAVPADAAGDVNVSADGSSAKAAPTPQLSNPQPITTQPAAAQPSNTPPSDTQSANTQPADAQPVDPQPTDRQPLVQAETAKQADKTAKTVAPSETKPAPAELTRQNEVAPRAEATVAPSPRAIEHRDAPKAETPVDPATPKNDAAGAMKAAADLVQNLGVTASAVHANAAPAQSTAAAAAAAGAAPTPMPSTNSVPVPGLAVEIAAQALAGKNRFEIRLDPPELGRIDVRLDIDRDGNVSSRLVVERVETLDMLRRDAPQLERALQQAGLKTSDNALEFSLRHQTPHRHADESLPNAERLIAADDNAALIDAAQHHYGRRLGLGGGIDIRV
jgi:flagellar hook-length control protein FliK